MAVLDKKEFGNRIRKARQAKGLTLENLAKVINKSFSNVSRFENGHILSCDYSQIELRVFAHMSNEKNLIDAFNSGVGVHALTASQVFNLPVDFVTPELRRAAKAE